ncbi:MAG: MBL fold metallo-hydrolase [Luteitalea sp.]|nr:MBL fold metallo-hydrolase [Luteitalea sp.]
MGWNRREFLTGSTLAIVGSTLRPTTLWAQQPQAVSTKFQDLRGNVGIFTGSGGTIGWYLADDGLVVIDSQFPDTAKACLEGLRKKSEREIDALINTHHHGDHTAGNEVFRPAAKKIVAHARVPDLLKKQGAAEDPPTEPTLSDTSFDETWTLDLGPESVSVKHYGPGHTGGDAVITFEKANVVHMGDLMFNHLHPFVDLPAGASIQGWMDQLGKAVDDHDADTIYIFGHAKPDLPATGPKADLLAFRDYLSAVLEHVQKGIEAGRSKEDITKLDTLPTFEDYADIKTPRITLTLALVLGWAYDELAD